ncbi:MAG TPA: hypothetical protein VGL91_15635 [Acidobacteriota bacterium]|jgi:hypothetical protein
MQFLQWVRAGAENVSQNLRVVWLPCLSKLGFVFLAFYVIETRQPSLARLTSATWTLEGARLAQPAIPVEFKPAEYLNDPRVWLFLGYFVLEIFLDAAIVASLATTVLERRSFSFFRLGRQYFWRFLRVALLGFLLTAPLIFLSHLTSTPGSSNSPLLIVLVALFAVDVVADYARVQTVLEERTCMFLAWLSAGRFVWQNGKWVVEITLLKLVSAAALFAWSNVMLSFRPTRLAIWLFLATIWFRVWLKAVTFATQIEVVGATADGPKLFLSSIAGGIREAGYRVGTRAETTKLA